MSILDDLLNRMYSFEVNTDDLKADIQQVYRGGAANMRNMVAELIRQMKTETPSSFVLFCPGDGTNYYLPVKYIGQFAHDDNICYEFCHDDTRGKISSDASPIKKYLNNNKEWAPGFSSITAKRFVLADVSMIDTGGGGATFIPGNSGTGDPPGSDDLFLGQPLDQPLDTGRTWWTWWTKFV